MNCQLLIAIMAGGVVSILPQREGPNFNQDRWWNILCSWNETVDLLVLGESISEHKLGVLVVGIADFAGDGFEIVADTERTAAELQTETLSRILRLLNRLIWFTVRKGSEAQILGHVEQKARIIATIHFCLRRTPAVARIATDDLTVFDTHPSNTDFLLTVWYLHQNNICLSNLLVSF